MIGPGEGSDVLRDADRLYSARSAMAGVAAERGSVGIAELVRFLTAATSGLPPEAQRALFASQRLRADFQRLKRRLRIVDLPEVAAASTGGIASRTFAGGSVRVHPSRMEGQVYMVFQFREFAGTPAALLLEDASNRVAKRPLPAPDALGQAVLVLDRSNPGDELFLQLFADPQTTGSFLTHSA